MRSLAFPAVQILTALTALACAAQVSAQAFYSNEARLEDGIHPIRLCVYGDSITVDASNTGNQTAGSWSKGVCDWCDPLVDQGWQIRTMATSGSFGWDDDQEPPQVNGTCSEGNSLATCNGVVSTLEHLALIQDAACPAARTSSCFDVHGDTTFDSTYMDDVESECDIFAIWHGVNDTGNVESASDFDLVVQAVIEKAASFNKPIVIWEPYETWHKKTRTLRAVDYRAAVQTAIDAVTTAESAYASVWSAYEMINVAHRNTYGEAEERLLLEDCADGVGFDQATFDADVSGQSGDCTHIEKGGSDKSITNGNVLGVIPADWMGEAAGRHIQAAYEAWRATQ